MNETTANASTKPFNEMTDAEKRVAVARDVIARLDAQQILPRPGLYIVADHDTSVSAPVGTPAGAALAGKRCEVCALGAAFVSICGLDAAVTVEHHDWEDEEIGSVDSGSVLHATRELFGPRQRDMIEAAFERSTGVADYVPARQLRHAVAFGIRHENAADRLRAIMQNIIDNHGEFDPTK